MQKDSFSSGKIDVGISRRSIRAVGVASGESVACYRLLKVSLARGTIPSVTPQAARQLPLLRGAFSFGKISGYPYHRLPPGMGE